MPVSAGSLTAPLSTPQLSQSKKLFLFAFDDHRSTSDTERRHDRPMRFQFAREPVSPVRYSGNPVNMGEAAQINPFSELASRVRPEPADTLLEPNSSDNAIR